MKPYYQDEWVTIYNCDCREILPELPKVDLVITSPPFNLGNSHHTENHYHKAYDDAMPEHEYQDWQINILNLIWEIVSDTGSLWYQHKNRIKKGLQITPYEWLLKTKWLPKQEIVWFNRSQNFDKIRFYPMTERIFWMVKSPKTVLQNVINKHDDWHITPVGSKGKHTRAFPDELVNNILYCFPDNFLILDPFLGSGTTAYCAKKLNRRCIGIESSEEYCSIAANRCSQLLDKE